MSASAAADRLLPDEVERYRDTPWLVICPAFAAVAAIIAGLFLTSAGSV